MTVGEIITTVLSALALVMSVVSLSWQIARARADRPELHIQGWVGCTVMEGNYSKAMWSFEVTVSNTGTEAITIDEVCWILDTPGGPLRVRGTAVSSQMPVRLEGKDSRSWTYEAAIRGTRWDGLMGSPSAVAVERPSPWRRRSPNVRRVMRGKPQTLRIPPEWKDQIEGAASST